MLQFDEYHGISKEIDIVKGINKFPDSLKESIARAKRKILSK